jgi:hypothetical protein
MSTRALQLVVISSLMAVLSGCATPPAAAPPSSAAAPTSVQAGDTTVVAVASPKKDCCTLPQFLGLTMLGKGIISLDTLLKSYLGMFYPGLEPGTAMTPITAQGDSSNPANSTAAQIKKEQDGAAQKIKSLRYLATIGCGGCYLGVEKAFLSALDDCTESVRFEAVKAIRQTAGNPCQFCRNGKCCSPKIIEKLHQIAYDKNDNGCFKEPSERVRRMARIVMDACGGTMYSQPAGAELPTEGPTSTPPANDEPREGPSGNSAANNRPYRFDGAAVSYDEPADSPKDESGRPAVPIALQPAKSLSKEDPIANRSRPTSAEARTQMPKPDEVRWERMTAPFRRFQSKEEARIIVNQLRQKLTGSANVSISPETIQKLETEALSWTRPDLMPTKEMSRALETTRLGETSDVFEDWYGVHLVRILERRSGS